MQTTELKSLTIKFVPVMLMAVLCSCSDSSVEAVKNSTFENHPEITIGNAFDHSFDNGKWESVEDKGKKYVRYTGAISQQAHENAVKKEKEYKKDLYGNSSDRYMFAVDRELSETYEAKCKVIEDDYKKQADEFKSRLSKLRDSYTCVDSKTATKQQIDDAEKAKDALGAFKRDGDLEWFKHYVKGYSKESQLTKEVTELHSFLQSIKKSRKDKLAQAGNDIEAKYFKEFWLAGSPVAFEWIFTADGKDFRLEAFMNDSWKRMNTNFDDVTAIICNQ